MRAFVRPVAVAVVLIGLVLGSACRNGGVDAASESPAAASPESAEVREARAVMSDIADGNYADVHSRFDEGMMAALSLDQLKQGWEDFVSLKGDFQSQGPAEVTERAEITVIDIELVMADDPGVARVTLNGQGEISGLFFLAEDIPIP